ncbi:MAG TPA: hypothetical protein VGG62_12110 [Terracidiphilus sp.]|jgi:hypothetical protein
MASASSIHPDAAQQGARPLQKREAFVCLPVTMLAGKLSPGAMKALMGLLSYRSRKTGQCNPKLEKLSERLGGVPDTTLRRWLRELRLAGVIDRTQEHGSSNSYTFSTVIHREDFHSVENSPARPSTNGRAESARPSTNGRAGRPHLDDRGGSYPFTEPDVYEPYTAAAAAANGSDDARQAAAGACVGVQKPSEGAASPQDKKPAQAEQLGLPLEPVAQPLAHPASPPDPAEVLVRELAATHPQPGLPRKAVVELRQVLAAGWTVEAIRERHAEWCVYWATVPAGKFIPMLWRWLESGEFESKPVIRKPPEREKTRRGEAIDKAMVIIRKKYAQA